jgi:methylase of polypeptide subunit release factors
VPEVVPELVPRAVREASIGGLRFAWDRRVLEPRPWTAEQSTWLADLAASAPAGAALELCCGAGHLGLLLAHLTGRALVQVDVDPAAGELARANAAALGLRTEVRTAPMDEALAPGERFALVLADPPWVERARTGDFPDDPVAAIDGGDDGTVLARLCVRVADRHLLDGGHLVLQVGDRGQVDRIAADLADLAPRLGLVEARIRDRGALLHLTASGPAPDAPR